MAVAPGTEELFWNWVSVHYEEIHRKYACCDVSHLNRPENGFKNFLAKDHVLKDLVTIKSNQEE